MCNFHAFIPFPSAGKRLEKILKLYHARAYENPFSSWTVKLKTRRYGANVGLFVVSVFDIIFSPPQFNLKKGGVNMLELFSLFLVPLLVNVLSELFKLWIKKRNK